MEWARTGTMLMQQVYELAHPLPCILAYLCAQANYAAANCALDAWSHAWQDAGCASKSVQWGAWASSGDCLQNGTAVCLPECMLQ